MSRFKDLGESLKSKARTMYGSSESAITGRLSQYRQIKESTGYGGVAKSIGTSIKNTAMNNPGTAISAGMGAAYGAGSEDTSMVGGAIMGGAAAYGGQKAFAGLVTKFGKGAAGQL